MGMKERAKAQIDGKEVRIEIEPDRKKTERIYEKETLPELSNDIDSKMGIAHEAISNAAIAARQIWKKVDDHDPEINQLDAIIASEKLVKMVESLVKTATMKDILNRGNQGTIHDIIAEEYDKGLAIARQKLLLREPIEFDKGVNNA